MGSQQDVLNGVVAIQADHVAERERLDRDRHERSIQSTINQLIVALVHGAGIDEMATTLTSASIALVPTAEVAKISLVERGRLRSIAATSEVATLLDRAQQAAGQGPCLDAVNARTPIRCSDLGTDLRWPRFAVAASEAGVRAVLSFPIDVPCAARATLSIFGSGALGTRADFTAAMLAPYAAIALFTAERERQFKAALTTRDAIGQAKGMLMERFGVDSARAFAMLKTVSQQTNTPVRRLAASVITHAATRDADARKKHR